MNIALLGSIYSINNGLVGPGTGVFSPEVTLLEIGNTEEKNHKPGCYNGLRHRGNVLKPLRRLLPRPCPEAQAMHDTFEKTTRSISQKTSLYTR